MILLDLVSYLIRASIVLHDIEHDSDQEVLHLECTLQSRIRHNPITFVSSRGFR